MSVPITLFLSSKRKQVYMPDDILNKIEKQSSLSILYYFISHHRISYDNSFNFHKSELFLQGLIHQYSI